MFLVATISFEREWEKSFFTHAPEGGVSLVCSNLASFFKPEHVPFSLSLFLHRQDVVQAEKNDNEETKGFP